MFDFFVASYTNGSKTEQIIAAKRGQSSFIFNFI